MSLYKYIKDPNLCVYFLKVQIRPSIHFQMNSNSTSSEEEYLIEKGGKKQREARLSLRYVYKIFPKIVPCVPERYILALLLCSGLCVVYALRVNLSIALVEMVNHTVGAAPNFTYEGDFDWDDNQQGWVLGSFFYGYILTQIPGGLLATYTGGKWVFGIGVLFTIVLTILTPLAAKVSVWLLIAVRVLEGIGEGVTYPSMLALWGYWAPPKERSQLVTISCSGAYIGNIISFPISGIICGYLGWEWVFYIFGVAGMVWFVFWILYAFSRPETNPRISEGERTYIENSLSKELNKEKMKIPWLQIWTSVPVWAICIASVCNNWAFYTLLICMPTFLHDTLGLSIKSNGLLSAIPYIAYFIMTLVSGVVADFVRNRFISTGVTRKIFSCLGLFFSALFLLLCGYLGTTVISSMVFLTLGVGLQGMVIAGHLSNNVDIAPQFAGIIMGITNMFANIPGFAGPQVAKAIAVQPPSTISVGSAKYIEIYKQEWIQVFIVTAEICVFGIIGYGLLGSGELQSWAVEKKTNKFDSDSSENSETTIN